MGYKLETIGLDLDFGRRPALRDVSTGLRERLITAVIGPSGCGKTTLLRCLNRMNDHLPGVRRRGRILLDGEDIHRLDPARLRARVGMVFQRPNPFPLPVFANIAYGPQVHGVTGRLRLRGIVEQALRDAGLWAELRGKLDRPAPALPLGQQQLLCLARLLAVEPEVILLDEPCSALDPAATARLEDLVRRLKLRYTVIIVTHSLEQAARLSDRTLFLLEGRLVEEGPTAELFGTPRDPRTATYLSGHLPPPPHRADAAPPPPPVRRRATAGGGAGAVPGRSRA